MDYKDLPNPFFVLAPMDDVTDTVFRQVIADCAAPDLYFTEFANVDGLQSPGRPRLMKKLKQTAKDQPLVAHIWGKSPENFYKTAQQIASGELGNFVGIDLNMGCPVKNVVGHGVCSALMNDRPLAHDIIEATQRGAGDLPVSVKTRLGYGDVDLTWHEFLLGHNLDMLTIHGRTRAQMSKVSADWDKIGDIRELRDRLAPDTLIVGNGDVMNRAQGIELAAQYKLDGIMIGRGVFHDPYAFAQNVAGTSPWDDMTERQRIELYKHHVELFRETWQAGDRPIHILNKFCKIYINGFDGAKEMREQLMAASSADDLMGMINDALAKTATE